MTQSSRTDRLLVVEDELASREAIQRYLNRAGFTVDLASSGEDALDMLSGGGYSLLVTDLRLPGVDGLQVIQRAHELDKAMGALLITAYPSVDSVVEALRLGAKECLRKPLILEELTQKVRDLLAYRKLSQENALLRKRLAERGDDMEIVALSPVMKDLWNAARQAARANTALFLTGEMGSGKEWVARAIHRLGPFKKQPFLSVNLAALPEQVVESMLVCRRGSAFTTTLHAAGIGTIYLNEIAALSLPCQARLLQALEDHDASQNDKEARAPFQSRIIASSRYDLTAKVDEGAFLKDLRDRLNLARVSLPPLRDRLEDIPSLVRLILERRASARRAPVPTITEEAMRLLRHHHWKGNIRELANVLERAVILSETDLIGFDQLPRDLAAGSTSNPLNLQEAVERFQRAHITRTLRLLEGNRQMAAAELGISLSTLDRRLGTDGIRAPFREHT